MAMMEFLCVALVSFAGVVLTLRQPDATISLAAGVGLGLYVLATVVAKVGRALIYPFYISGLRNVPGPKVHQTDLFFTKTEKIKAEETEQKETDSFFFFFANDY